MSSVTNRDVIDLLCKECGINRKNPEASDYFLNKEELLSIYVYVRKLKSDAESARAGTQEIAVSGLVQLVIEELERKKGVVTTL